MRLHVSVGDIQGQRRWEEERVCKLKTRLRSCKKRLSDGKLLGERWGRKGWNWDDEKKKKKGMVWN